MKNFLHHRALAVLALAALMTVVAQPALSQETAPADSSVLAAAQSAQLIGALTTAIPVVVGGALLTAGIASNGDGAPIYAGYLLASSGVIFGPSIADWRGGLHGRGVGGMFLRMGVAWGGLITAGLICLPDCEDETTTLVVLLGSQGVALGLAIWEVATVKQRVIKHRESTVSVTPTFSPETGAIGFAARVRF